MADIRGQTTMSDLASIAPAVTIIAIAVTPASDPARSGDSFPSKLETRVICILLLKLKELTSAEAERQL